MRASSNNHYQKSLPFTDIKIHSNKLSEEDTGYDSLSKQQRLNSIAGLSSSSSSNNQCDHIVNLVKNIPSPTDISTINDNSDINLTVAQRIAQFSKKSQLTTTQTRKLNRTRVQPILDSTSDSADSFALSNPVVFVPSFGGNLEYIHDNRFDSTTTVDHVKNDIIAIELMEQQQQQLQTNQISDILPQNKQQLSWINYIGESIRLLPANILAIVFIGLIGGLIISAILVIIIA